MPSTPPIKSEYNIPPLDFAQPRSAEAEAGLADYLPRRLASGLDTMREGWQSMERGLGGLVLEAPLPADSDGDRTYPSPFYQTRARLSLGRAEALMDQSDGLDPEEVDLARKLYTQAGNDWLDYLRQSPEIAPNSLQARRIHQTVIYCFTRQRDLLFQAGRVTEAINVHDFVVRHYAPAEGGVYGGFLANLSFYENYGIYEYHYGRDQLAQGDIRGGMLHLERALEGFRLAGESYQHHGAEAAYFLAQGHLAQGELDQAEARFEEAQRLLVLREGTLDQPLKELAREQRRLGVHLRFNRMIINEAQDRRSHQLNVFNDSQQSWGSRGRALWRMGRGYYEQARGFGPQSSAMIKYARLKLVEQSLSMQVTQDQTRLDLDLERLGSWRELINELRFNQAILSPQEYQQLFLPREGMDFSEVSMRALRVAASKALVEGHPGQAYAPLLSLAAASRLISNPQEREMAMMEASETAFVLGRRRVGVLLLEEARLTSLELRAHGQRTRFGVSQLEQLARGYGELGNHLEAQQNYFELAQEYQRLGLTEESWWARRQGAQAWRAAGFFNLAFVDEALLLEEVREVSHEGELYQDLIRDIEISVRENGIYTSPGLDTESIDLADTLDLLPRQLLEKVLNHLQQRNYVEAQSACRELIAYANQRGNYYLVITGLRLMSRAQVFTNSAWAPQSLLTARVSEFEIMRIQGDDLTAQARAALEVAELSLRYLNNPAEARQYLSAAVNAARESGHPVLLNQSLAGLIDLDQQHLEDIPELRGPLADLMAERAELLVSQGFRAEAAEVFSQAQSLYEQSDRATQASAMEYQARALQGYEGREGFTWVSRNNFSNPAFHAAVSEAFGAEIVKRLGLEERGFTHLNDLRERLIKEMGKAEMTAIEQALAQRSLVMTMSVEQRAGFMVAGMVLNSNSSQSGVSELAAAYDRFEAAYLREVGGNAVALKRMPAAEINRRLGVEAGRETLEAMERSLRVEVLRK